jgi:hypothetical protein
MRPISQRFQDAVRYPHAVVSTCDVTFPDGTTFVVPIEGGEITIDRTAIIRRTGGVRIPWTLDSDYDVRNLAFGGYATVRRGVRFGDETVELVDLGRLRVESVSWRLSEGTANLELADRMAQVRDEPFVAPYSAKGKRAAQAAVEIVQGVFGDTIAYETPYAPTDTIGDVIYSGTRADALSQLEQGYGAETYFNADGDFVFAEKPGDSEPVVWMVDAGQAGVLVGAIENLDRTGIYNGVLVKGQATSDLPPVSALATFDDPSSPIRWGGPFGKVALVADSSSVATAEQAAATAQSLLRLRLKQTRSLELTSAPNPALEAGDTIEVLLPDGRDETHLIDAVTVDLGTVAQKIVTRTLFVPTLGALEVEPDRLFYGRAAWREVADARLVTA